MSPPPGDCICFVAALLAQEGRWANATIKSPFLFVSVYGFFSHPSSFALVLFASRQARAGR